MHAFGKKLTFHTNVFRRRADDWKLYAMYFSLRCWLPESRLTVSIHRDPSPNQSRICMHWVKRPDLDVVSNQPEGSILLPITSVAIASEGDIHVVPAKSKQRGLFADYSEGVGSFLELDTETSPLWEAVRRFGLTASYANEIAVLDMWRRAAISYEML